MLYLKIKQGLIMREQWAGAVARVPEKVTVVKTQRRRRNARAASPNA